MSLDPASLYTEQWLQEQSLTAYESAKQLLGPILLALGFIPSSIIDLGGGIGAFVAPFYEIGIRDITVVEGPWAQNVPKYLPASCFLYHDLQQPWQFQRKYQLCICTEVAEHLPPSAASTLIHTITQCSDICLFSAAIPGQGGTGHVNEQPPSYWQQLFATYHFHPYDVLKPVIHDLPKVAWWYKQNLLFYAK